MAQGPDRGAQHLANALESLREDAAWPRACGPMAVARLLEAYDAQAARLAAMEQERDRYRTALELIREMGQAWARGEWPERDAAVTRLQELANAG